MADPGHLRAARQGLAAAPATAELAFPDAPADLAARAAYWAGVIEGECWLAFERGRAAGRAEVEAELTGERQRAGFDSPPPAGVVCDGSGVSTPGVPCSR